MNLFETTDFRAFTLSRFESRPKKGHGQLKKLAAFLRVHTTYVSQVFKGDKSLSAEQGIGVAEFLELTDLETKYFIKLIQLEKAGTEKLKALIIAEISALKKETQRVSNRLAVTKVLPDEQKAIFYSAWYYSAVRLLIGIDGYQDADEIARHFNLPRKLISEVIKFLVDSGLLLREGSLLKIGPKKTHLEPESPFVRLHHLNWRNRALLNLDQVDNEKLHYSSPMTLGIKDVPIVRNRLVKLIEDVGGILDPSPNEELMCLNIDWFRVK